MQTSREISSTAQKFLEIHDIANDLLILKDGATALIITVSAMNFGLLAEEEQDAIIYSYAGLLNSLNYPIQIVIKSQTKDVTSYLHLLDNELEVATSHTKREWIKKYRSFVANLIRERNVLDKKFYVVIPATALEMGLLPPSTVIPGVQQPDLSTVERSVILEKAREILEPKRDHMMAQFGRIGLVARQLTTQEIIQLFYLSYNPEAAEGQQITDTNSYTTPLVRASVIKGGNMSDSSQVVGPNLVAPATSPAGMSASAPAEQTTAQTTMPTQPPLQPESNVAAPVVPAMTNAPVMPVETTPIQSVTSPTPMTLGGATPSLNVSPTQTPVPTVGQTNSEPAPVVVPASAMQANLSAMTMPAAPVVNTLNSAVSNSATESVNLNDLQSEIDSAAQQVAPDNSINNSPLPTPTIPNAQTVVSSESKPVA